MDLLLSSCEQSILPLVCLSSAHYTFFFLPVTGGLLCQKGRTDLESQGQGSPEHRTRLNSLILFLCSKVYILAYTPMQSKGKTDISTDISTDIRLVTVQRFLD